MNRITKILKSNRVIYLKHFTKSDPIVPKAIDFLKKHYIKNDPVFHQFKDIQDKEVLVKLWEDNIQTDTSLAMFDMNSNKLINVFLNKLHYKGQDYSSIHSHLNPSKSMQTFLNIELQLWKEANFFGKFPEEIKVFEFCYSATHPEWRNDGVLSSGVNYIKDVIVKEHNCKLLYSICTNVFSAKTFERIGFQELKKILYKDIKIDGRLWVQVDRPHEGIISKMKYLN